MIIDPIRRTIYARGLASGLFTLAGRLYRVNPRHVDRKRKAKDRAHRKATRRHKAVMRRAGKV